MLIKGLCLHKREAENQRRQTTTLESRRFATPSCNRGPRRTSSLTADSTLTKLSDTSCYMWKWEGMAQAEGTSRPGAAPGQPSVFKLVLLGSGSVGKSSLALRYVKNDFKSILPTVGCAFFTKVVSVGAASLKFEIWDTAGQEKYHSVCHLYFRGANAALLVYDITKKDSFHKAQQWLRDLEKEFLPGEVVVMLVGNKTDLAGAREVTFQVGFIFCFSCGLRTPDACSLLKAPDSSCEMFDTEVPPLSHCTENGCPNLGLSQECLGYF
ncbi:ras-related protein Rab-17 isoform X2 [Choloepus didactylus]|uniref:ras-related protein Rab-17 isoform X2 n=1 Tax=Choloepus didactylus TaxID=27675 RepID=UPI00189E1596|nr:ras-related protein Rab-17 isoform X2 [Choloepus didactylus]